MSYRKSVRIGHERRGWTLVELLVVIGIVGLLLQLLLPAIHAVRSSTRLMHCKRNLKELGRAATVHHESLQHLPSGGWHYTWIGVPERGTGVRQPGGWAYNLLDYLDASSVRSMGRHRTGLERAEALRDRCKVAPPSLACPARRVATAYPQTWNQFPYTSEGRLSVALSLVAKSDYAANVGDAATVEFPSDWQGPIKLAEVDDERFKWPGTDGFHGVIYGRSRLRLNQIRDGLAKTYLFGEKYVDSLHYTTGKDWGDNESLYAGFNNDTCRSTLGRPQPDQPGVDYRNVFGSNHRHGWQAVMCDGSVRWIDFHLDPELHRRMGTRYDRVRFRASGDAAPLDARSGKVLSHQTASCNSADLVTTRLPGHARGER